MCEFSVFPIFLENDLFKSRQNPRVDFFLGKKDFEGFNTAFFHLLWLSFMLDGLFTTPIYSVEVL